MKEAHALLDFRAIPLVLYKMFLDRLGIAPSKKSRRTIPETEKTLAVTEKFGDVLILIGKMGNHELFRRQRNILRYYNWALSMESIGVVKNRANYFASFIVEFKRVKTPMKSEYAHKTPADKSGTDSEVLISATLAQ